MSAGYGTNGCLQWRHHASGKRSAAVKGNTCLVTREIPSQLLCGECYLSVWNSDHPHIRRSHVLQSWYGPTSANELNSLV
jgi:hypothetical protein